MCYYEHLSGSVNRRDRFSAAEKGKHGPPLRIGAKEVPASVSETGVYELRKPTGDRLVTLFPPHLELRIDIGNEIAGGVPALF